MAAAAPAMTPAAANNDGRGSVRHRRASTSVTTTPRTITGSHRHSVVVSTDKRHHRDDQACHQTRDASCQPASCEGGDAHRRRRDEQVRDPRRPDVHLHREQRRRRDAAMGQAIQDVEERGRRKQPERQPGVMLDGRVLQLALREERADAGAEPVLVEVERRVAELAVQPGETHGEREEHEQPNANLERVRGHVVACLAGVPPSPDRLGQVRGRKQEHDERRRQHASELEAREPADNHGGTDERDDACDTLWSRHRRHSGRLRYATRIASHATGPRISTSFTIARRLPQMNSCGSQ